MAPKNSVIVEVVEYLLDEPNRLMFLEEWLELDEEERREECPITLSQKFLEAHTSDSYMPEMDFFCERFCEKLFPEIIDCTGMRKGCPCTVTCHGADEEAREANRKRIVSLVQAIVTLSKK